EIEKILKELSQDEVLLSVNLEKKSIRASMGKTVVVSRLVEGDYPPYQKILPESTSIKVVVDRKHLIDAVKAAGLFSQNNANLIKFTLDPMGITVKAQAKQVGNQETHLEAKVEGTEESL